MVVNNLAFQEFNSRYYELISTTKQKYLIVPEIGREIILNGKETAQ